MSRGLKDALMAVLLGVAILSIYAPSIYGRPVFDDVTMLDNQEMLSASHPLMPTPFQPRTLTFAVYWIVKGGSLLGFHLANMGAHWLTTCLVALLAWQIGLRFEFRWLAAGLFAVHPIQTESVAYISQLSECLASLFMVAGLCAWFWKKNAWITLPFAALAIASKETGIALLLVICALDLMEHGFGVRQVALAGIGAWFALKMFARFGTTGNGVNPFEYWSAQLLVFWRYIRLLVWPVQSADWDIPHGTFGVRHALSVVAMAGLASIAVVFRKFRFPLMVFGTILVPMSVIPLYDVMVEHRLYFPMIGAALAFGTLLQEAAQRSKVDVV